MIRTATSFPVPLIVAIVLSTALKLWLCFATPVGSTEIQAKLSSYNDEIAHIHYISHLLETRSLPVQVEAIDAPGALERGYFENYQPPLYYVIVAAVCKILGVEQEQHIALAGRLCNLLFSIICIVLAWKLGAALSLSRVVLSGFAILTALNGDFIRFGSTASNDMLLWVCAGLILLWLTRAINTPDRRETVALICALTAALYTKASSVLLLPICIGTIILTSRPRNYIRPSLLAISALILTLPVWLRNLRAFGELIPLTAGFGTSDFSFPPFASLIYALRSFFNPFQESWSGGLDALLILPLAACLLGVFAIWGSLLKQHRLLLTSAALLSLLAFFWLNLHYLQAEAKYLFVTWPVFLLLFAAPRRIVWSEWFVLVAGLLPLAPLFRLLGEW